MALVNWEPFGGISSLRREIDRLFGDFEEGGRHGLMPRWERSFEPAVEVSDTKEAVVIRAQVPGMSKDDVHVDITDNALTVKGEIKEEEAKEEKHYYRREIRYGTFSRVMPLPMAVKAEEAKAQMKDGILEITIPKSDEVKVKEIPIQTS